MVIWGRDFEDSLENERQQRRLRQQYPERRPIGLSWEDRERMDIAAKRTHTVPEYRRVPFIHFEDEFKSTNGLGPNYCIKCCSISRVSTGGTTVVPDGSRRIGFTPYFGGAISEDKVQMQFVKGEDESGKDAKWVCPRCLYEVSDKRIETETTRKVDAFQDKTLRDILQIKPTDKRKFGVMTDKHTNNLLVVSKDFGTKRWSKYPVSEENMVMIDDELKNEFFDIFGMEISTPEEWLKDF